MVCAGDQQTLLGWRGVDHGGQQRRRDLEVIQPDGSLGGWVASVGISLPRLNELTGLDLSQHLPTRETPIHNLNGWIIAHLARIPTGGEVVEQNGLRALVRKVRRQRVLDAQLSAAAKK